MQKILPALRAKSTLIATLLLCTVVSSASSFMIARASIPDSSGTIHGCRNNSTTMLRVIDSDSQSCDANETALNWDQRGVKAGAFLVYNSGTMSFSADSNRSYNITNVQTTNQNAMVHDVCITVPGTPQNVLVNNSMNGQLPNYIAVKDANGWTNNVGYTACNSSAPNANVYIQVGSIAQIVTIF